MSKATVDALSDLHGAIATELTRRIQTKEASAADIGAAIKFLKDNAITASIEDDAKLSELRKKLAAKTHRRHLHAVPAPGDTLTDDEADTIIQGIANTA